MADSKGEAALKKLFALIQATAWSDAPVPTVRRNEPEAVEVPAGGLVNLRDGDMGDPETFLSPPRYAFTHRAEVSFQVQERDSAARDALMDSRLRDFVAALAGDPTLGDAVEYVTAGSPENQTEAAEAAASIKAVVVPVFMEYVADTPLG